MYIGTRGFSIWIPISKKANPLQKINVHVKVVGTYKTLKRINANTCEHVRSILYASSIIRHPGFHSDWYILWLYNL
jgi:hypothetical protein